MTNSIDGGQTSRELCRILHHNHRALAEVFSSALTSMPRWKLLMDRERSQWDEFLQAYFFVFVDYLVEYFRTGDATYKQLFIGEKIKSQYDAEADDATRQAQTEVINRAERQGLETVLQAKLSPDAWHLLSSEIDTIHLLLSGKAKNTQHVLLIGDCIFLDIIPFIVGDLLESGIRLVPDYATSKNPPELRDQLRNLSGKKFDLVFVSPFSYEFVPTYSRLTSLNSAFMNGDSVRVLAEQTWSETRLTLDLMADLFDCPIHVHNSAAIVREENTLKRLFKHAVTARLRGGAKRRVNELLRTYIEQKNRGSFRHMFVFDEDRIVKEFGECRAGAFYHHTALQHPAVMGRILALHYTDVVFANAHLVKKKLVVCDLDNTLWDGVIGEGAVIHHHGRQQLLKELKSKGVVLAINSKNDPANVHWRDATLSDNDFVYAAISWDPKVQMMKRIQTDLNLKMKDFVFVDDREDELDLMRMTYPDVLCLDAKDPNTWERFALWKDFLEDDLDMDRTLMYRQREQRKAFIKDDISSDEEKTALFTTLQLRLKITRAQPADLKRVAELINRTNQFNLEGSRTSFKEVTQWHASHQHLIITGQTADRFGDMGTTCVAIVRFDGEEMILLPFVLSCRVFGYGIERSMLNYLKIAAAEKGVRRIVGRYIPTPQNAPCKDFLRDNGFLEQGECWVFDVGTSSPANAAWLQVEVAVV
ncbi:MAG: HAD-IIIC family phosphatase [Sulfuricaulis sp.]